MKVIDLPIEYITVPKERFRPAHEQTVEEIMDSITRFGQLQPIIVESDNGMDWTLVDGLHRLVAASRLGHGTICAVERNETDPLFLREMELETNIRRKEMTWQERTYALSELHKIKQAQNPNWGTAQTAELVGASGRLVEVSEAVLITKMIELFPEIGSAKNKAKALVMARTKAKLLTNAADASKNIIDYDEIAEKLWEGDSVELIKRVPSESIHAIITDPPFGIDFDNKSAGSISGMSSYTDDEKSYERLLTMAPDLHRVICKDGWLIWFLGISWYEHVKQTFRSVGFTVDEIPIIWDRSEGTTITRYPNKYFGRAYDIALHCHKGEPDMVIKNRPNIIRVAPVENAERELLVERPVGLYQELIQRLTHPGQRVADFFVGSGACLAAAAMLRRDFFGIELSPERRAVAMQKIRAHIPRE